MIPRALCGDPLGLVIVDWSLLVRKAWHISGIDKVASIVLGRIWQLLADPMPPSICIAVDPERVDGETGIAVRRRTWRDKATDHLPEGERYKAGRIAKPADLVAIETRMMRIMAALKIPFLLPANAGDEQYFDADDAIGSAVKLARADGRSVAILSEDKDLFQCVTSADDFGPPVVRWWPWLNHEQREKGEPEEHDDAAVLKKMSVLPSQIVDLLAIMGDAGDNVPGVSGIGDKSAAELLFAHSSLDAALLDIDRRKGVIAGLGGKQEPSSFGCDECDAWPGSPCVNAKKEPLKKYHPSRNAASKAEYAARGWLTRQEKLLDEQRAQALASRTLVQLWDEAPIRWDPQHQMVGGFDVTRLRTLLQGFGFSRMADTLPCFPKAAFHGREVA
jgi:5'-3' exonuclease